MKTLIVVAFAAAVLAAAGSASAAGMPANTAWAKISASWKATATAHGLAITCDAYSTVISAACHITGGKYQTKAWVDGNEQLSTPSSCVYTGVINRAGTPFGSPLRWQTFKVNVCQAGWQKTLPQPV